MLQEDFAGEVGASPQHWQTHYATTKYQSANRTGTVPRQLLEDRFEVTYMPNEDTEARMDKYQRDVVRDYRPDAPIFDYELPRRSGATNAGLLNLRLYGQLGTKEPDRPEIFLGFLDSGDPRGTATDPDWTKVTEDTYKRAKRLQANLNPDNPGSNDFITGGGISQYGTNNRNQQLFYPMKDRMNWFSTSLDAFPAGKTKSFQNELENRSINTSADLPGTLIEDQFKAPDKTTLLSMYTNPNWQQNDQRVKVSRYGMNKKQLYLSNLLTGQQNTNEGAARKGRETMTRASKLAPNIVDIAKALASTRKDKPMGNKPSDSRDYDTFIGGQHGLNAKEAIEQLVLQYQSKMGNAPQDSQYQAASGKYTNLQAGQAEKFLNLDGKRREEFSSLSENLWYAQMPPRDLDVGTIMAALVSQKKLGSDPPEYFSVHPKTAALTNMPKFGISEGDENERRKIAPREAFNYKTLPTIDRVSEQIISKTDRLVTESQHTNIKQGAAPLSLMPNTSHNGGRNITNNDRTILSMHENLGLVHSQGSHNVHSFKEAARDYDELPTQALSDGIGYERARKKGGRSTTSKSRALMDQDE